MQAKTTKPQIIYVLGGPGSGKGTQCDKLVRDFKFKHISVGDLFRAELATGSDLAKELKAIMDEGKLVPTATTVKILLDAIKANQGCRKFLIDGFPRSVEQAFELEKQMFPIDFILDF